MVKRRISVRRVWCSFHRIIASRYFLAIATITIGLNSCYNEPEFIGGNIIPSSDILSVKLDTSFEVSAFTVQTDTIPTGLYNYGVLGTYNSEIFGKTKSDFLAQLSHGATKDTLYAMSPRPSADSIFLFLTLVNTWGDVNKNINVKVYELAEDLADTTSNSFIYCNGRKPITGKYLPTQINSETITYNGTQKSLKIKLTPAFADKLTNAPDSTFMSNNKFVKYMKGLYITSDDFNEVGGALYSFYYSMQIQLHYHYYSTKKSKDSLRTITYYTGPYFPRFNHIVKDYSTARADIKINHLNTGLLNDTIVQDSVFYISGLGGTRGLIKFKSLQEWVKKMPIAINRAELRLEVQEHPDFSKDSIISPLQFYLYRDYDTTSTKGYTTSSTDVAFLSDYQITQSPSAAYHKARKYYSYNVTVHLQNLLSGRIKKDYFYIEPTDFKSGYREGIFRSGNNSKRIKLIITYTKL
jgi:hypothetical protein